MTTNKLRENKSPKQLWQEALTHARDQLGSKGYSFATETRSRDALQLEMQRLSSKYQQRGVPRFIDRMAPFIGNLSSFSAAIDTYVSAKPDVAALVWGSLKAILKMAVRFLDILGLIVGMFEDMETRLPRFEAYHEMFDQAERLEKQLAKFYITYISFCVATIKFFQIRQCWAVIRVSWGKQEHNFKSTIAKMDSCKAEIEYEAGAAFYKVSSKRHEELKALYAQVHVVEAEEAARLPCRIIAFLQNPHFFPRPDISNLIEDHFEPKELGASNGPPRLKSFVLFGLGGVGKTQIVQDYAYRHWNDYAAIFWVTADTAIKLAKEYSDISHTLGVSSSKDQTTARKALKRWLESTGETWLLIFDNADDVELLMEYWPSCTHGHILMTSRNPQSQDITTAGCLVDVMSPTEGASMLLSLVKPSDADSQKGVAVEIADELGGLPLALSQMSGYMLQMHYSMERFLNFYKAADNADALLGSANSLNHFQYKKTLENVWQISLNSLGPKARDLVGLCAFLDPDDIPESLFLEGSHSMDGWDFLQRPVALNLALGELMKQSLLKRNPELSSLSIHRLVQRSALKASSDNDTIRLYHVVTRLLYKVYPRQSPLGEPIPDWPSCAKYTSHVLALHEEFKSREDLLIKTCATLLTELFCDCGVYLWAHGQYNQAEALAKTSIQLADFALQEHDNLRAQPYTLLGCVYIRIENSLDAAIRCLDTALQIRKENSRIIYDDKNLPLADDIQLANAYSNLGIVKKQAGEYEAAASLHQKSMDIKQKYPIDQMAFLLALSYDNLGRVREAQGELQDAARLFSQATELLKDHSTQDGTHHRMAQFTCSLARVEAKLGQTASAEKHFWDALEIFQKTVGTFHTDAGLAAYHLGSILSNKGEKKDAMLFLKHAEDVFSQPLTRSPAKLAATKHRLHLIYRDMADEVNADLARSSAQQIYTEITGVPPPAGSSEEVARSYESLNRTD